MVEWSTHKVAVPVTMAGYLRKVRSAITQPVTTNDNWLFWASVPKVIAEVGGLRRGAHLPLPGHLLQPTACGTGGRRPRRADGQRAQAMIDASIAEAKRSSTRRARALVNLNLGQPADGDRRDRLGGGGHRRRAQPGFPRPPGEPEAVLRRAAGLGTAEGRRDAQGPKAIFFFQAFDEPWKQGDDGWGLFNAKREARYTVQGLGTCGVTWACEAGSYTTADAVKWVRPTLNPGHRRQPLHRCTPNTAGAGEAWPRRPALGPVRRQPATVTDGHAPPASQRRQLPASK